MKKIVNWALLLIPIIIISILALKGLTFLMDMNSMGQAFGRGSSMGHHGFHGGRTGYVEHPFHLLHGHTMFIGTFIIAFFLKLAMIVLGWFMWSKSNSNKLIKGLGMFLFTIGIYMLLPTILGIPFLLIMAFVIYKNFQKKQSFYEELALDGVSSQVYQTQTNRTDYLDEWERIVRKEEK